jgi:hypothetical protein
MDLNANDKLILKQIVTKIARSVRDMQLQHGMAIWKIRDLKHTIERDILKNPELPDLIAKVKTGENPLENLTATEKYAKSLSDTTPASNLESVKKQVSELQKEVDKDSPTTIDKELREYYGIKLPMSDHLAKVEKHWDKAEPEDWADRYRWVYDALYKQLPEWKRDVVDAEPEDRITNEFAKEVLETAQDFELYDKLYKSLPDESETKAKLAEQLLSTHYERRTPRHHLK